MSPEPRLRGVCSPEGFCPQGLMPSARVIKAVDVSKDAGFGLAMEFELEIRLRFAYQVRMGGQRNYQLAQLPDKIFSEISVAYIWLKNSPSRQAQREKASERVIFANVPKVQQPLRFESPCGNRGNSNPAQGGERSCVRGSGVGKGTVKATVSASRKTRLAN